MTSLLDLLTQQTPDNLAPADNWQRHAACVDEDPETFFPIGEGPAAQQQIRTAKDICNQFCPVRETCLQWALDHHQHDGVWGGLSEAERRSLKRQARRNRTATQ